MLGAVARMLVSGPRRVVGRRRIDDTDVYMARYETDEEMETRLRKAAGLE